MANEVWVCSFCGGPAVWTDIRGDSYFHCEQMCEGFRRVSEPFESIGVAQSVRGQESDESDDLS